MGYDNGAQTFLSNKNFFNFPDHISHNNSLDIIKLNYDDLICSVAVGKSWNSYSLQLMEIKMTPHFQSISDNKIYSTYLKKFIGGPIKDYNSPKKFKKIKANFKYLSGNHYNSYVIVKKHNDKYLVLDGLHRCALHFFQGNKSIITCLIN